MEVRTSDRLHFTRQKWVVKLLVALAKIFASGFGWCEIFAFGFGAAKFLLLDLAGAKILHLAFCPAKCSIFPLFWNSLVFDHQKLN